MVNEKTDIAPTPQEIQNESGVRGEGTVEVGHEHVTKPVGLKLKTEYSSPSRHGSLLPTRQGWVRDVIFK